MLQRTHDPYSALRVKEFLFFLAARLFLTIAIQMQGGIIGWQIKIITNSNLHLGLTGLAEAIPFIITSLFAGHVADTVHRKKITIIGCVFLAFSILSLLYISLDTSAVIKNYGVMPIYILLGITGIIRGFLAAAVPAYMAQIVTRDLYANAATWNTTIWHTGYILGNAVSGFLCAISISFAYGTSLVMLVLSIVFFLFVAKKPLPVHEEKETLKESLSVGLKFVFSNKIILGALSLDLFAVLFGGAVALLPSFAKDILKVDAIGFGFLRAAPAIGAVIMAFILAYNPIRKNAGRTLLISIALFGIATILFALSSNYLLSVALLAFIGAFDNISVVIRHTILQLMAPDNMRGRVSAVNNIFIGSSNEIGAFESGLAAEYMGLIPSVIFGGAMTIAIVIVTAHLAPALRKMVIE
jgi:MFS family permease